MAVKKAVVGCVREERRWNCGSLLLVFLIFWHLAAEHLEQHGQPSSGNYNIVLDSKEDRLFFSRNNAGELHVLLSRGKSRSQNTSK
jgi:hypothetical protein